MRIAFVDHISVSGGIIRYATNLANAICRLDPKIEMSFFTHQKNYDNNKALFDECAKYMKVEVLTFTRTGLLSNKYIDLAVNKILRTNWSQKLSREISGKTRAFDAVYFTTAHASDFIEVTPPSFATFHDLNWKYLFGTPLFPKQAVHHSGVEALKWMAKTHMIVSTPFVRDELVKFYPDQKGKIDIVFLPNLAKKITTESDPEILKRLKIDKPYILYPGHLMSHKNHISLFHAFWKLSNNPQFRDKYLLVLSGWGSDHFEYGLAGSYGLQLAGPDNFNVRGLGYLSNKDMDMVIKGATLITSTSVYEAGSGPALDAWINEVPVTISHIRSHLDQLEFFGIDCHTFDPMDPSDICRKLEYCLSHIDELKQQSRNAAGRLEKYTWSNAAAAYLDVFKSTSQ